MMLWTIRISMALYAAALLLLLYRQTRPARLMYTLACALLWVHVPLAFHFVHHWSHAGATVVTAEQTRAVFGFAWGGGVYVNYILMAVWAADAAYWWLAGDDAYRTRPRGITWTVHGFILFIAFNAAVVFAHGTTRWISAAATVGLLLAAVTARDKRARAA
jgi:hypothetical protein